MKTERRHELQENELANWLGEKIETVRPYGKTIAGLLVLGAVGLVVMSYVNRRNAEAKQAGWSAYFEAMGVADADSFEEVAKSYSGTTAAAWALQTAGDVRLGKALEQMFMDRSRAQEELEGARQLYERALAGATDPMLKQRALFGLGKCLESQGKLDEARQNYEQTRAVSPESPIAALAQQRLDQLQQSGTQQWYNWFAEQQPAKSPLIDSTLFQDPTNFDLSDSPDLPTTTNPSIPTTPESPLP